MHELGKLLTILGLTVAGVGLLLWLGVGKSWLGKLPGDVSIQKDGFSLYFPITTCIAISVVLTIILWLVRR